MFYSQGSQQPTAVKNKKERLCKDDGVLEY